MADNDHYHNVQWKELLVEKFNVVKQPVIRQEKVLLAPLLIKLLLRIDKQIRLMFTKFFEAKINGGIFIVSQVKVMLIIRNSLKNERS